MKIKKEGKSSQNSCRSDWMERDEEKEDGGEDTTTTGSPWRTRPLLYLCMPMPDEACQGQSGLRSLASSHQQDGTKVPVPRRVMSDTRTGSPGHIRRLPVCLRRTSSQRKSRRTAGPCIACASSTAAWSTWRQQETSPRLLSRCVYECMQIQIRAGAVSCVASYQIYGVSDGIVLCCRPAGLTRRS